MFGAVIVAVCRGGLTDLSLLKGICAAGGLKLRDAKCCNFFDFLGRVRIHTSRTDGGDLDYPAHFVGVFVLAG